MLQSLTKLCLLLWIILPLHLYGADMSDYREIETTINNYFNGLKQANRTLLEKAFLTEGAHMKGYLKGDGGKKQLTVRPMSEVIDEWAARKPDADLHGEILSVNIYSDVAATVLFNFNDVFVDSFQLAKTSQGWRIVNKYYIDK